MNWSTIKKDIKNREVYFYFLLLSIFFMPIRMQILPHLIMATGISWLFTKDLKKRLFSALKNTHFILISLLFCILAFGLLYTQNLAEGFKTIEIRLSLVVIPLIIFSSSSMICKRKKILLNTFIAGNVVGAIICVIAAFINAYNNSGDDELFNFSVYYSNYKGSFLSLVLSGYSYLNYTWLSVLIHANYFSMYITLTLFLVYKQLYIGYKYLGKVHFGFLSIFLFLLIILILLQSRASFIAIIIIGLFEIINFKRRKLTLFISGLILISFSFGILNSGRFKRIKKQDEEFSYTQIKNNNIRLQLWEASLPIISDNLFFGVGTGDNYDEFHKVYSNDLFEAGGKKFLNFHNEYIETLVRNGLIGLSVLLFILFFPFFCIKNYKRNRYLLAFCIILIINFLFESMLSRLNGVVFLSLFYSLFHLNEEKEIPIKIHHLTLSIIKRLKYSCFRKVSEK